MREKEVVLCLGLLLFCSCATSSPGVPESGIKLSASVMGGLDGELEDGDMDHAVGARIQVRRTSEDFPAVDLGLRFSASQQEFSDSAAGVTAEVEGWELSVAPTVRYTFPTGADSKLHPYVEGFVGYSHLFGRFEVTGLGSSREDGGGVFYGVGGGLEYELSENWAAHAGVEATWSNFDVSGTDFDQQLILGVLGFTFTF